MIYDANILIFYDANIYDIFILLDYCSLLDYISEIDTPLLLLWSVIFTNLLITFSMYI